MLKHKTFGGGGGKRSFEGKGDRKEKLGYLPDEMMAYYRQVSATLEAGFDDEDPSVKRDFLCNVFNALKDEGVKASQNQTVSRILENLFTHSEGSHLRILFIEFCKHLATVSFDRFASHVLQSLIQYLPTMYDDVNIQDQQMISLKASIEQLCQYSLAQIRQFMTDTYGSHVLRSLLETLGGVQVKEEVIRSHISRNQRKDTEMALKLPVSERLSSDFRNQFDAIRNKVISLCNYKDHLTDANYCPVLQTIMLILHKSNSAEYDQIAQTLMSKACPHTQHSDKENISKNLPPVVQDSVGSYLIELVVGLTSPAEITSLYNELFQGKLIYFAVHPVANFVLQKLFSCISDLDLLKEVVTEVTQFMEDVLAVNHIGVITKLAEACKKNQAEQEAFTQGLMKAFHCHDPEDRRTKITPLIASMQTFDIFFSSTETKENEEEASEKPSANLLKKVNLHGSLLLQQMFYFDRPKPLVTSLLSLSPAELSNLASDLCGSHVVEAFFSSSTVWDRNKEEFLKKIKGFYVQIGCNKYGSRCLEGIWKECAVRMKALIAEELLKSRERVESDRFGRYLYNNFALLKFATRKKEWMDIQAGMKKKQLMLQAILDGDSSRKKKNRKRKAVDISNEESGAQAKCEVQSKSVEDRMNEKNSEDDVDAKDKKQKNKTVGGKKKKKLEGEVETAKNDTNDGEGISHKKKKSKKKKLKK